MARHKHEHFCESCSMPVGHYFSFRSCYNYSSRKKSCNVFRVTFQEQLENGCIVIINNWLPILVAENGGQASCTPSSGKAVRLLSRHSYSVVSEEFNATRYIWSPHVSKVIYD